MGSRKLAHRAALALALSALAAASPLAARAETDPFQRIPGFDVAAPGIQPPPSQPALSQPALTPANSSLLDGPPPVRSVLPNMLQGSRGADAEPRQQTTAPAPTPQSPQAPQGDFRSQWQGPMVRPGESPRQPVGQPPRISTRQSTFAIPFSVAQPKSGEAPPSEVQLFVSERQGSDWRLESRVAPGAGRFLFRAPRDGEYWFQVRTLDANGLLIGAPSTEPGLRVLVDTTRPDFDIQPRMLADGKLEIHWSAGDPQLRPDSLKLEYQLAANSPWLPIPGLDPALDSERPAPGSLRGQYAWPPGVEEGAISLRGEVADAAGNRNLITRRVHVGKQLADLREQQRQAASQADPRRQAEQPHAVAGGQPAAGGGLLPYIGPPSSPRDNGSVPWPADHRMADSRTPWTLPPQPPQPPGSNVPAERPGATPPAMQTVSDPRGRTEEAFPPVARHYEPVQEPSGPARREATDEKNLPRYVRSKTFLLDYGLDTVSGVRKRIVLWATRDGGRTWNRFGEDPDGHSPFEVTVAEPGLYGFSIVAEPLDAEREYVPRSGEPAQSWIMIDPDAPQARLTSVQLDPNGDVPHLQIRWQAFDENLVERPISLYLSDRPDGQWFRIATDLENGGHYTWRLDEGLPPEIFLRLVVRDEADNTTEHVAEQPIRLDDLRPNVHIRGVRSSQRMPTRIWNLR